MTSRSTRLAASVSLVSLFAVVSLAVTAGGCQESISQSPCNDVPAGGCPLSHGQACADPTCAAAYACNPDGTWTLDHVCAGHDASAPDASTPDAADASPPPAFDAAGIDAAGASGGPGCAPLQPPECALGLALACPAGCCGCEDLFVCDQGGWSSWGTCGDAGLTPSP
jgi:hypothetical protein